MPGPSTGGTAPQGWYALPFQVNSIIREGKRQRFCQQCGRFHDLTSFDGDKRSCRARLQRHNARRRKKCGADGAGDAGAGSGGRCAPPKPQCILGSRGLGAPGPTHQWGQMSLRICMLSAREYKCIPDAKHASEVVMGDLVALTSWSLAGI